MGSWWNELRGRTYRRTWFVAATAAVLVFAVVGIGSAAGATSSRSALVKNPVMSNISLFALGSVSTAASFEGDDGDLTHDSLTDWNDFASLSYSGTAPYQTATKTVSPWQVYAVTDARGSLDGGNDTTYAGGVKQADECPTIISSGSNASTQNKDDLARIYIAGKLDPVSGHVFLALAWVRVPLNTTSSDLHIAFEFNQSTSLCGSSSSSLVHRTAGDILIVYNFQSGAASLAYSTWTGSAWTTETTLPGTIANAAVFGTAGATTSDALKPSGAPDPGTNEFGEAILDLTQAQIDFSGSGRTCERFGRVFGESRSSGSSTTSAMEDLVGPANVDLSNCATPSIATSASPSTATLGQATNVKDTATVTNANAPTGNVAFQLYSDSSCSTPVNGVSGSSGFSGSGPYTANDMTAVSWTPTAAGTYYWKASYAGDGNNNSASTCGGDGETITVAKASPSITTSDSPSTATVGTAVNVSDTATLTGAYSPTGTVSFQLYSDASCTTTVSGISGASAIAGSGPYTANGMTAVSWTPTAAGTYYWGASYAGDGNNNSVSSCGGTGETIVVSKASPTITTQASPTSSITVGTATTVGDTATLHSGVNPTGSVTFTLYSNNTCTTSTGVTGSGSISSGSATFSTSWTPQATGTYYWKASYAGDGNNNGFTTSCGDANEQLTVGKASPTITTQASPTASMTVGTAATVGDTATFHSAFNPTGSVTFTLYSNNTCTTSTGVTGSGTISSGSASFSNSFTPQAAQTYYWKASYAGDSNNNSFTTSCGDANEQITAGKATPTITTQASPTSHLTVGTAATVGDTATLHGAASPTGNVTFTLYANDTCTTSTGVSGSNAISGTSASFSTSFTPQAAGTYYWQASYAGDANNAGFTTGCTDANEQLVADKASPTITTQASPTGAMTVGTAGTVGDTATFHNAFSPTGNVTFTLYSDNTCSTSTGVSGDGAISSGSASFSHSFTPSAVGTYYWKAHYAGDSNNDAFTTGCADANEQITVVKTKPSIATTLSATTGAVGDTIHDSSTLTGATSDAGGHVTYTVYSDDKCSAGARDAGTVTVTNGSVPDSNGLQFNAAGTFYWQASYTGDGNNEAATSPCQSEVLSIGKNAPTITTTLSATDGAIGDTVHDGATLHGATADASGTATYHVYTNNDCSTLAAAGTDIDAQPAAVTVSSGDVADSPGVKFLRAGDFYWQVTYSGDANNTGATSPCNVEDNEHLAIAKNSPTLATTLSATEINVGSSVHDSATLTGATANAGGTVTYSVFTNDSSCDSTAQDAGTVDVQNGQVPNSNGVAFPTAGTYYWQASYSGDANNDPATSACTEEVLKVDSPSISITKNPKSQSITAGDTANFTITVKNTGTVTLTNVTVVDLLAPNCAKVVGTLTPGQSTSYDCALSAVQQSFTNSATATGHPPVGPDVTASDTAPVTVNQLPPPPPPPPPAPKIDLAITKVGTPNPTTVNKNITWTLTVVNNGPNNATGVTVADPIPGGTTYVSSTSTQGTCTGGAMLSCQIGNVSVGQTVTVTLVTTANQTGTIPNTATVVGNEAETNTANNTASASVNVVGVFKPPVVYCTAVAVSPKQLFVGRTNTLKMRLTQHGKAAKGVKVRIKGSTISVTTKPSNRHGLVTRKVKPMKAGIVTFTPVASKRCNAPRVGVIGVFTPPVTG